MTTSMLTENTIAKNEFIISDQRCSIFNIDFMYKTFSPWRNAKSRFSRGTNVARKTV